MLQKYFKLFYINLKTEFAYTFEAITGFIASIVTILVTYLVWSVLYSGSSTIAGLSFQSMITYAVISIVLQAFLWTWIEFSIEEQAKTGSISMILVKPVRYMLFCFFTEVSDYVNKLMKRAIPILIIGFLFLGISFPSSLWFIPSAIISVLIMYEFAFMIGIMAFWTDGSIWGFTFVKNIIINVFSGAMVPFYFFPEWFKDIMMLLPFQAAFHSPLSIYIGKITGYDIYGTIALQLFWLFVFGTLGYMLWKRTENKVMVFGG